MWSIFIGEFMETVKYEIELEKNVAESLAVAFAAQYSYSPTIVDENGETVNNPKTIVDNWRECTAKYWQDVLNSYLKSEAIKAAEAAIQSQEVSLVAKSV
jgi:hypothetical protein